MKKETQTIEFKQSWHDEYLEWICGYANAYGGTLYIGCLDDGTPVGVAKTKALMESIPCKITDTMGIITEAWGRGFDKIRRGCEEYGGELPGYEISENGIMVLCKACPSYLELLKSGVEPTDGRKGKGEVSREDNADNREDNADNLTLVMNAIMRNPRLTVRQLATELPISKATVERAPKVLQKVGKLRRVGGTRGSWVVLK